MMKRVVCVIAIGLLGACGKDEPAASAAPGPAPAPPPMFGEGPPAAVTAADQAKQIWETGCVACHGPAGRGDGSMAAQLTPRPRDHGDPAWQDAVTDDEIAKVIVGGGAALGKSASMPARPDLAERPEVLAELVRRIRGFRR